MRVPRDISGEHLITLLAKVGYSPTRSSGSHVRLTRISQEGEHHLTVPRHKNLRVGTLNSILHDAASHLHISKQELLHCLFFT